MPADPERLWFAIDVDDGVLAVAPTRREVMRLALVPTRAEHHGHWERHRYGPGAEEIVWGYPDDEDAFSTLIYHGIGGVFLHGGEHHIEGWVAAGSPIGLHADDWEPR